MINKCQIDYLPNHPDFKVVQHKDMYHFNSDSARLGEFFEVKENESLLDVGTNNGVLLVYASMKGCHDLTGIDINKKAIKIAKKTLRINKIKAKLIAKDYKEYEVLKKYDVIVSNPPYFTSYDEKEKSQNANIKIARHDESLSLNDLIIKSKELLKEDGRLYLIYPYVRLEEINAVLKKNKLVVNRQIVGENNKKEQLTVLMEIQHEKDI